MTTRTAKGTNSTKVSGTTLVVSSVSASENECLYVGVVGKTQTPPTGVTWGGRNLALARQRIQTDAGFTVTLWIARNLANTSTRDVTVTWGSAINARAMIVSTLDIPFIRDSAVGNIQTASTAPTSNATGGLSVADAFAVGLFACEGPSGDTAPTPDGGFSSGQRVGTTGGGALTNLTLLEVYEDITADCNAVTASGTGATSRDWANICVALRKILSITWDVNGNEIQAGDFVIFEGTEREVTALLFQRNIITLDTVGNVEATQVELSR